MDRGARRLIAIERPAALLYAAAAVAAPALLLAFAVVLYQAVVRGEQRQQAMNLLHRATWQCNALRSRVDRVACVDRLRSRGPDAAAPP